MRSELTITSTAGLHAALASKIVHISSKYDAQVWIEYEDKKVDAKSILGLMSLAVPEGRNVKVISLGDDAEKALNEIKKLLS
jgi:phosphotransferase system HPr (HPr) family protein